MAEANPPPKRKRGHPPAYVLDHDGKPVVGISLHKVDERYYVAGSKPPHYLGNSFDEALVEFREYQARQRKEFESVPAERAAGVFKGRDLESPYLFSRMQWLRGFRCTVCGLSRVGHGSPSLIPGRKPDQKVRAVARS